MQSLAIIMLCVLSAVVYGIVHDQVTARVCVEYFTVGHPPVFRTDSPTLLGLGWGVIATWWVGVLLGVPLAIAARAGRRQRKDVRSLVRPVLVLLGIMGTCALAAGVAGYALARGGSVPLFGELAERVPPAKHAAFMADLWAHSASYLVGFIGAVVLIVFTYVSRSRAPTRA